MLAQYLLQTRQLLQNPGAPNALYSDSDLTGYINTARGQIAGESASIRGIGSLTCFIGNQVYNFTDIVVLNSGIIGIEGVLNVKTMWFQIGQGQKRMTPRPFEWFSLYDYNTPVPTSGQPKTWAQYAQGANGTIYIAPVPDVAYTLLLDCMCYPVPLVDDTTPEAIPYLWTDAVPYFAAYLALLSSQTGARTAEADKMFQRYGQFVQRARIASTPSANPDQYQQVPNPVRDSVIGQPSNSGGGQQ